MLKTLRLGILILLLSFLFKTPCTAEGYLDDLHQAVSQIELGSYDKAAELIQEALAQNTGDPLGHTAMGVVFMHTGRYPKAHREFKAAMALQPGDWHLYYALGMVSLAEGHRGDAEAYFKSARNVPDAKPEFAALDAYMKFLSQHKEPSVGSQRVDLSVARETYAIWAYRKKDYEESAAILGELLGHPVPQGLQEYCAPLVTFNPSHAIAFPKGKLSWQPPKTAGIQSVSGIITLRADTTNTPDASLVSFFIDGTLAAMTNSVPFEFRWNTGNYTNGIHEVKIEAWNYSQSIVSRKTFKVIVSNAETKRSAPMSGPLVGELKERLWNCIRLRDSRKLASYYLAKIQKYGNFSRDKP